MARSLLWGTPLAGSLAKTAASRPEGNLLLLKTFFSNYLFHADPEGKIDRFLQVSPEHQLYPTAQTTPTDPADRAHQLLLTKNG